MAEAMAPPPPVWRPLRRPPYWSIALVLVTALSVATTHRIGRAGPPLTFGAYLALLGVSALVYGSWLAGAYLVYRVVRWLTRLP